MIRSRTGLMLAAAAALALVAAWVLAGTGDAPRTSLPAGTPLFADLPQHLPQARRIEVLHRGHALAIARTGSDAAAIWGLPEHAGFPVRPAILHGLLSALGSLRLIEPRTSNPDLFDRLGLGDPAAAGATGTLIRVLDSGGAPLAAVILGDHPDQGATQQEVYVRSPESGQTWLASGSADVSTDWRDWVDRQVVDILPEDVAAITSQRSDGPPLRLAGRDGRLMLLWPADAGTVDRYKLDDMGRALSNLELLDVSSADQVPGPVLGEAIVTTRAGLAIHVAVHRAGEAIWLVLSALATANSTALATATALQQRIGGWAFSVDPREERALVPTLDDLGAYRAAELPAAAVPRPRPSRAIRR